MRKASNIILYVTLGIYIIVSIIATLMNPQPMFASIVSYTLGLIIGIIVAFILTFIICLIFYKPLKDKNRRRLVFAICCIVVQIALFVGGIVVAQSMIKVAKEKQEQRQLEEYNRIQFK